MSSHPQAEGPTISPSFEEFVELAAEHRVIPVWQEMLADLATPVSVFQRLVGDAPGFLLESVAGGQWSRWSFVGRNAEATLVLRDDAISVEGTLPEGIPTNQGMLAALEALLEVYHAPDIDGLPPMHGGLVGFLGYDVVREVEHLPDVPTDDLGFPDAVMSVVGELAALDHWAQRVTLIANAFVPPSADHETLRTIYDGSLAKLATMAADGAAPLDEPLLPIPSADDPLPEVTSSMGKEMFCAAVEAAREYIFAGDIFQVVLSQRFDFSLDAAPYDFYRVLRQINPSPYMYFVQHPELTLVGGSPEPMVKLTDDRVISRPIAGTRRRGANDVEDRRMESELREDPKEIAEHVMLLDLARNDVGRVVTFGTEQVDERFVLERYSHVMHLTSQVSGQLAEGKTPIDVLRATLPAGTLSGAPKVRAMEIIDELEPVKRGPYGGVVGYFDFSGNIDTAITIRTLFVSDGQASVQAGAGIVADSIAAQEHLECENKARALLAAVETARRMTAVRTKTAAPNNTAVPNNEDP